MHTNLGGTGGLLHVVLVINETHLGVVISYGNDITSEFVTDGIWSFFSLTNFMI